MCDTYADTHLRLSHHVCACYESNYELVVRKWLFNTSCDSCVCRMQVRNAISAAGFTQLIISSSSVRV